MFPVGKCRWALAALALCVPLVVSLPCIEVFAQHRAQDPILYDVPSPLWAPGWDPQNPLDITHQATIIRGFHDAIELAKLGEQATKNWKKTHRLFGQYFGTFGRDSVEIVHEVFESLIDPVTGGASNLLVNVFFNKLDVSQACTRFDAYLQPIDNPPSSQIHVCDPKGYAYRELHTNSRSCDDLGDTVNDTLMNTFARLILHEFLHHPVVGRGANGLNQQIVDKNITDDNGKDFAAYGPYLTRWLAGTSRIDATMNADNYAWFAQELYWETTCKQRFNPPHPPDEMLFDLAESL